MAASPTEETTRHLLEVTAGFNALFANDLKKARDTFGSNESPFHLLGSGVCAFLEAALGMEVIFMFSCLPPCYDEHSITNTNSVLHQL